MFTIFFPHCLMLIYIFFQNASIHQSVLTLRATDQDDGSNAEFTFEFKNGTQVISI